MRQSPWFHSKFHNVHFPSFLILCYRHFTTYMTMWSDTKVHYQSTKIKYHGKIQEITVKQFFDIYQKSLRLEIADFATQRLNLFSKDPAKWVINESGCEYFLKNQVTTNFQEIQINKTFRKIGKYNIKLPREAFYRKLLNGEYKYRDWLLYSKSQNSLFCFYCYFLLHVKLNLAVLVLVI